MKLEIDEKFKRLAIEKAIKPIAGLNMCYKDRYWVVTDKDEILFYRGFAPQCNSNEEVVKRMVPDNCTVKFLPFVFVNVRTEDFDIRV